MILYHHYSILTTTLLYYLSSRTGTAKINSNINNGGSSTSGSNTITVPVSPTTHVLFEGNAKYRKLLQELEGQSFPVTNAIYGSLEEKIIENDAEMKEILLEHSKEFHKHRHLSRFSRSRHLEGNDSKDRELLSADKLQVAPLLQGLGTHYVTAWVGTPPQRKSVIVDTGSKFTAFPCTGCVDCGAGYHTDSYFDPELSSTYKAKACMDCPAEEFYCAEDQCHFGIAYSEGSTWDAHLVSDMFFVGGNTPDAYTNPSSANKAVEYIFGCQTYTSGLFVRQHADGIMGMAAHEGSLHHRLYAEKKLSNREFSMCFGYQVKVTKEGVHAGILTLGGSNDKLHDYPMVYAKDFKDHGFYTVYIRKLYLCPKTAGTAAHHPLELRNFDHKELNSGTGTIVDSGTTDIYFPSSLYEAFTERWLEVTGFEYTESTFDATEEQIKLFPDLVIQLSGMPSENKGNSKGTAIDIDKDNPTDVILEVPATFYMERDTDIDGNLSKDRWISRLFFHDEEGVILGALGMIGYDVHFDVDQHRVGFAKSDCNYDKRVLQDPAFKSFRETTKPLPQFAQDTEFNLDDFIEFDKLDNDDHTASQDGYRDGDCTFHQLELYAPCWESVDTSICADKDKFDKTGFLGLETYRGKVNTVPGMGGLSCESVGYSLLDDISLLQCYNNLYCDMVVMCTTTCDAVLSQGKVIPTRMGSFQGPLEQPQLGAKGSYSSRSASAISNLGYYGITMLLMAAIMSIGLSVYKDENILKTVVTKYYKSYQSKNGDYSRLATNEKHIEDDSEEELDDDDNYEMKSLINNKKKKKKQKKRSSTKDDDDESLEYFEENSREELSLFDEVLEENKNYFGEYADTSKEEEEVDDGAEADEDDEEEEDDDDDDDEEDAEFVPLTK